MLRKMQMMETASEGSIDSISDAHVIDLNFCGFLSSVTEESAMSNETNATEVKSLFHWSNQC